MRRDVSAALQAQGFRTADINNAANRMSWSNGQTFDGQLKLMLTMLRPAPAATSTTRTMKVAVVNQTLLGHTVKLVEETTPPGTYSMKVAVVNETPLGHTVKLVNETPPEKYTVKGALVDESQLTLPQTIEQRVKKVPA
jgi:RNase P/RNase MRP subunit p29